MRAVSVFNQSLVQITSIFFAWIFLYCLCSTQGVNAAKRHIEKFPNDRTNERVKISKGVSGLVGKSGNALEGNLYEPGGKIIFTLRVDNVSGEFVSNIPVTDRLSLMSTEVVGGSITSAFDKWTIAAIASSGSYAGTVSDNKDIDTLIHLAVDGFVEYVITADIRPDAIGRLVNIAAADGLRVSSDPVSMKDYDLQVTHTAFADEALSESIDRYEPGQTVYYEIRLENKGGGTFTDGTLVDILSDLKAKLAKNEASYPDNPVENPFESWQVTVDLPTDSVSSLGGFSGGLNADINVPTTIAAGDVISIIISAKFKYATIGDVVSVVSIGGQSIARPLQQKEGTMKLVKSIIEVGGQPFDRSNPIYAPGDTVVYELKLHNFEGGWADDLHILDKLSMLQVEVLDGQKVAAFDTWSISISIEKEDGGQTHTYVPEAKDNQDIEAFLDIGPKEIITATVRAKIRDDALGTLPKNKLEAGYNFAESPELDPAPGALTSKKTAVSSATGNKATYENNGELQFRLEVTNTGKGFAKNIQLTDALDTIKSTDGQVAFKPDYFIEIENWKVNVSEGQAGNKSKIEGDFSGNVPLNAVATIAPGDTLSFLVTTHVNADVTGEIVNRFRVTDCPDATAQWQPAPATFTAEKSANTTNYAPGDTITYTLKVTNSSNVIGTTTVIDNMSQIMVMTADGTEKTAFSNIQASYVIEGDTANSKVKEPILTSNHDLNTDVTLAANLDPAAATAQYTSAVFTISGVVRDDATGDIVNVASVNDKPVPVDPIKPPIPIVEGKKIPTKTPAEYKPGETVGFDIVLTNTGKGFSTDTYFEDLLANVTATSLTGTTISAILAWDVATSTPGSANSSVIAGTEINDATGYRADYVIAPGDTITIHLEGKVVPDAVGDLKNHSHYQEKQTGAEGDADALYQALPGVMALSKTADKPTFVAGQPVSYQVQAENTGEGWLLNQVIEDDLGAITAEVVGGGTGSAFVPNTLQVTQEGLSHPAILSVVNNKLTATAMIGPGEKLSLHLTAQTQANLVGQIPNMATFNGGSGGGGGGGDSNNVIVDPVQGSVTIEKKALTPTYQVGEPVSYQVVVKNTSTSIANDVKIEDVVSNLLVDVIDGSQKPAFLTWTFSLQTDKRNAVTDLSTGQPFTTITDQDLNVNADLFPNTQAIFTLTGTVIIDAISDIRNSAKATVDGGDPQEDNDVIKPGPTSYIATKKADMPHYKPDHELSFTISIENNSKNVLVKQQVVDDLSAIQVILSDGTEGPAFQAGSTAIDVVPPVPTGSVVNKLNDSTFDLTLLPGAKVFFKAKGIVNADAVGPIQNAATTGGEPIPVGPVPREPPDIKAEFNVSESLYVSGQTLNYKLRLYNNSDFPVTGVEVEAKFAESLGEHYHAGPSNTRVMTHAPSFGKFDISATTDGGPISSAGEFQNGLDINTAVDLGASGGYVEYTITPNVNIEMASPINVDAYYHYSYVKGGERRKAASAYPDARLLRADPVNPVNGAIVTTKVANKPAYGQEDDVITYTMTASNTGAGNMHNIILKDDLSTIVTSKGRPVFKSWKYTLTDSTIKTSGGVIENTDLHMPWNFLANSFNTVTVKVEAVLNSGIDEPVTNIFRVEDDKGGTLSKSEVTTPVLKAGQNEGKLIVSKTTLNPQIQPNGAVEYELTVSNPYETAFLGFEVTDRYPAGFRYIEGSSKLSNPIGSRSIAIIPTETPQTLHFKPLDLQPGQSLKIRYVLKASLGISFGQYKNVAYAADDSGARLSNEGTALVAVVGDKLFDTTAIIGKVFEDHSGNGYQSDATARNITIDCSGAQGVDPKTVSFEVGGVPTRIRTNRPDWQSSALNIPELAGQSVFQNNRPTKARLSFKSNSQEPFGVVVSSATGSSLTLSPGGKLASKSTGDLAAGRSSEQLNLTRNLYKQADGYLWEIIIENTGLNDDGIPGVRLITPEGFKVETDSYGRFHIPDRYVLDSKGKNVAIKLDTDSLPTGMQVMSENPKVKRVTPYKLNKFNFSVQKQ